MLFHKLNNWLKSSIRLFITVFVCGLFMLSAVSPVQAATSKATDGEASLNRIQAKTDDVARSNPRGMKEVSKKAQNGLNGVQGSADKGKMVSPEDSNATTVREQAAKILDNLTD